MNKEKYSSAIITLFKSMKKECMFHTFFCKFAENSDAIIYNKIYNHISMIIMGFARKELLIQSVHDTLTILDDQVLRQIHQELNTPLIL